MFLTLPKTVCCYQYTVERAKKLQNMDNSALTDLALELEGDSTNDADEKAKNLNKKKAQVQQRLAAEKKREAKRNNRKKGGKGDDDDDDDDDDAALATFAKASGKKKN